MASSSTVTSIRFPLRVLPGPVRPPAALAGQRLRGHDWRGEIAGVMGIGRVGKSGRLAAGDEPPVAVLPVRRVCADLLPVNEGRLVAPVIQA
jgi:hypothetical protein